MRRILWNPKVHYRIYNSPPPVPTLSQPHLFHALPIHFLKIHLNIILPSTPWTSKLSQVSPPKPCMHLFCPSICPTCPAHIIQLDFVVRRILAEQYRSLRSFLHSPVTSSLLGPNILLSTLFSAPSAYVPPSM